MRAAVAGIGLTLAAVLVSLVGGVALTVPLLFADVDIQSTPVFLALTVAGQLGFVVVAYAYARRHGLRIPIELPDLRGIGYALGGTVGALVIISALSLVVQRLDLVPGSVITDAALRDPNLLLGLAVLSVVLVAPIEEFLFRGVIQGRLREAFGPVGAITGSSLLFGSVHLANYTGSIGPIVAGAVLIAVSGAVLGFLYEWTENLTVPIITHALFNVVQLVAAYSVA